MRGEPVAKAAKPRICIIKHPGSTQYKLPIEHWAEAHGYPLTVISLNRSVRPLGKARNHDLYVVMGGAPNTHETNKYPWLVPERDLIRSAAQEGKMVLGICLGSQQIAVAHGGQTIKHKHPVREWSQLELTSGARDSLVFPPMSGPVMGLHSYQYGIKPPPSARVTLTSRHGVQGFEMHDGRVVGILPHLEPTPDAFARFRENTVPLLLAQGSTLEEIEALDKGQEYSLAANQYLELLLNNMLAVHFRPR